MKNMIAYLKQKGNSKIQETLAEYAFLKDLLIDGVRNNLKILISRSDFDEFGYDVLAQIEGEQKVTKLQLKAFNGKASVWDIHKSLVQDENGNVVVIRIHQCDEELCFDYLSLTNNDRKKILSRPPKKLNDKKCKLNKGDLEFIEKNKLIEKILKYTPNNV